MPPLITLRGLTKVYQEGSRERQVLQGLDAEFGQGEFVAVRGRSGSGKTTLLNLIAGIDLPSSGEISIAGQELTRMSDRERTLFRRRHIGFVFQFFHLIPTLTVLENVALPAELAGVADGRASQQALDMLSQVGMHPWAEEYPDQLSGGEKQRVAVARALLLRPPIVLADEPTGNLDSATAEVVMSVLTGMSRDREACLILVTHSREWASRAERQFALRDGRLEEDRAADRS
jgi:putative ABC transport system ATP-binding protein